MYVVGRPAPALAGVVRAYGGYDECSAVAVRRREVPSGSMTLILAWAGELDVDGAARPGGFLAGMTEHAGVTTFVGRQAGVQVDLTPLGALRLLGRPVDELTGRAVDLDALDAPADLAALPARLRDQPSWSACFAEVDAALSTLLANVHAHPDPEVDRAWSVLVSHRGRVPVNALAADVGWSRRHLLTRFRRQVGLTPTAAGRVLRFRHATELLLPGRGPERVPAELTLARVAAEAGYADHSHLVREFHALAGVTPSALVAEYFPDVQDDLAARS